MIPFNRPCLAGREIEYMQQAAGERHLCGDGRFTAQCQELLKGALGARHVLLTTSCTHALEMSALLLKLRPGDEVIIPSFTFVSTVNAFVLRGVRPVFADIRPDTLNLDEAGLEKLVTPKTRAIVPVHYAGVGCEMAPILQIAQRHGLAVVEDNAHGLFGRYREKYLGTFGAFGTLSFHETKNFTCGEGGALLINDDTYLEAAEIVREKGTNRRAFLKGAVDKYTWVEVGSSYLPSDLLAAFLYAQLEAKDSIQEARRRIWSFYRSHLDQWAREGGVQLPAVPAHCDQPYHMFYMLLPTAEARERAIPFLRSQGVGSAFHYLPLHLSGCGLRLGGRPGDCPVTEDVSARLLRLPFYNELTEQELLQVVAAVQRFPL
ncbi:MAG: dTDP-4-amino-4,6-dideoxygalactose transaminase [Acidobacteria bacterium]|nr:dTDP-4-amino-4,6-dideoxygalactose transaminase [Acidobacteriota bacterium]